MNRLLLMILLYLPLAAYTQKLVYLKATAGNYWMSDMKEIQQRMKSELNASGIPGEIVTSFPVSIQADAGVDFRVYDNRLREFSLGGFLNYAVTEGRINYSDYSGSYDIVQTVSRLYIGSKGGLELNGHIEVYCKAGVGLSQLKIASITTLEGIGTNSDDSNFTATGIIFEPGFQWNRDVGRFRFSANAGYEFNFNSKTFFNEETYLVDDTDNPLRIDWSGFRVGVSVGLLFK